MNIVDLLAYPTRLGAQGLGLCALPGFIPSDQHSSWHVADSLTKYKSMDGWAASEWHPWTSVTLPHLWSVINENRWTRLSNSQRSYLKWVEELSGERYFCRHIPVWHSAEFQTNEPAHWACTVLVRSKQMMGTRRKTGHQINSLGMSRL